MRISAIFPSTLIARFRAQWNRIRPLLGSRLGLVVLLAVVSIVGGLAEAGVLIFVADVAAALVLEGARNSRGATVLPHHMSLGSALVVSLLLAFVRLLLQLVVAWLPARLSVDVQAQLRKKLFTAYTRASWSIQADETEGHLQELMTGQIHQATTGVLSLANALSAGAMFATLVASALSLDAPVAGMVLLSSIVLFGVLRPLDRLGGAAARTASQAGMDHAAGVSEAVRLSEETQVFGVGAAQRTRVEVLIDAARRASFRAQFIARIVQTVYQSLVIVLIVAGLSLLYLLRSTDLAELGAVVLILVRAAAYGQQFQGANHLLIQTLPYIERLHDAIERYVRSAPADSGNPLPSFRTLAFQGVTFSYSRDRFALHDITFEITAGETIGIIGPTGAGKSTLSQLLLRLRDPVSGNILLNDRPLHNFSRTEWQQHVAYVPQEPRVFQGTIADNIRFFRDLTTESIHEAARLSNVHEDIMSLPLRYATVIGQRADAVSGGQRQRICLARALAGQPQVLLLDEPTSSLDVISEAAILSSLASLHGKVTMFIVAHRIPLLTIADRILVINSGTIEAFGPPSVLQRTNPFYDRMIATTNTAS